MDTFATITLGAYLDCDLKMPGYSKAIWGANVLPVEMTLKSQLKPYDDLTR